MQQPTHCRDMLLWVIKLIEKNMPYPELSAWFLPRTSQAQSQSTTLQHFTRTCSLLTICQCYAFLVYTLCLVQFSYRELSAWFLLQNTMDYNQSTALQSIKKTSTPGGAVYSPAVPVNGVICSSQGTHTDFNITTAKALYCGY